MYSIHKSNLQNINKTDIETCLSLLELLINSYFTSLTLVHILFRATFFNRKREKQARWGSADHACVCDRHLLPDVYVGRNAFVLGSRKPVLYALPSH